MDEQETSIFKCQVLDGGVAPRRAHRGDAGWDLHAAGDSVSLAPGDRVLVSAGIKVAIGPGYYGRIAPRSGLAVKHGIDVMAGVCDRIYRGEVKVCLINHGKETFEINPGDRIAQFIITAISEGPMELVDDIDVYESDRGDGGFGSTGQ